MGHNKEILFREYRILSFNNVLSEQELLRIASYDLSNKGSDGNEYGFDIHIILLHTYLIVTENVKQNALSHIH